MRIQNTYICINKTRTNWTGTGAHFDPKKQ